MAQTGLRPQENKTGWRRITCLQEIKFILAASGPPVVECKNLASRLVMSACKRPAAAGLAASPKKRLRGKQEDPSYNESLPQEFLAWRAQHIYAAYTNLGGAQLMKELVDNLALAEPNPAHYAEYMGIYMGGRLALEGQPPIACLRLLVDEWAAELTVAEWQLQREKTGGAAWKKAQARKKPAARKRTAGKAFCKGFGESLCRFNTKEAGRPSWGAKGEQSCLLCSKALFQQSQATPRGCGNVVRVLKALRAHKSCPDIFEAACGRVASWLSLEAADALRAKAAAPKRLKPRQSRAAARKERLSAAKASFALATAKRQAAGPAPPHAAWRAYRDKTLAEQRLAKKKFFPEAARRPRAAPAELAAATVLDNSPDLPAASYSQDAIALQNWCLRGAWGACPACNILQSCPLLPALSWKSTAQTCGPRTARHADTACASVTSHSRATFQRLCKVSARQPSQPCSFWTTTLARRVERTTDTGSTSA